MQILSSYRFQGQYFDGPKKTLIMSSVRASVCAAPRFNLAAANCGRELAFAEPLA